MRWLRRLVRGILFRRHRIVHQRTELAVQRPTLDAQRRGIRLLTQHLTPDQRAQYKSARYFHVVGGTTGTRYRIRHGLQFNVEIVDTKGRCHTCLCFAPTGHLVEGDVMLAQKVALELFESEALRVANRAAPQNQNLGLMW